MITVENFYWVLYHTLLKPSGLDCRYFYPFGTTQHLSEFEFNWDARKVPTGIYYPSVVHHVLFHFDQEPLYEDSDQAVYQGTRGNWLKNARILANSERSGLKQLYCERYALLDWYFFYHGFAALDWYSDTAFVDHDQGWRHLFLSFNHLVRHKRSYRIALTARLAQRNLLASGLVSFHGTRATCEHELGDPHTPLSARDKCMVQDHLLSHDLPLVADSTRVDAAFSARMGPNEYQWRQRAFWQLVNETVFYDQKLHLTEKIFQPIVVMRPFILVAAPGNLAYLRSYGFKTFSDWIDESYDGILDHGDRLDAVAHVLQTLAEQPWYVLQEMYRDMQATLAYNKQHFFTGFRQMIVDELVDNFATCVRLWNNGRVDGRELPLHPNLELVKKTLLR